MRIKSLTLMNFKGARNVRIEHADPECIEIAGKNGAGKSSGIDGVIQLLAGRRNKSLLDEQPLTNGMARGFAEAELEPDELDLLDGNGLTICNLFVKRSYTAANAAKGGRLTITDAGGEEHGQTDIDAFLTWGTFDPLAFERMTAPEQISALQELAGAEWCTELKRLQAAVKGIEKERTDAGRDVKRFGTIPALQLVERVDVDSLLEQAKAARRHNEDAARVERDREAAAAEVGRVESAIEDIEDQLLKMQERLREAREKLGNLPPLMEYKREAEADIAEQLRSASDINARAEQYEQNETRRGELRAAEKEHARLEQELAQLRFDLAGHFKAVNLPIPGLTWSDSGAELDGKPWRQLSFSERLRNGCKLAHAISGKLRVMCVREHGESLDADSWAELRAFVKENKMQLWIASVGPGHGDALVIEEGELESFADEEI